MIKNKSAAIVMVVVFLLSLTFPLNFKIAGASSETIKIATERGSLGDTVSIDLTASSIEMAGYSFIVYYDPEYLEPLVVEDYIDDGNLTYNLEHAGNQMSFMWFYQENLTVDKILKIDFEIIKEISGITEIYIDPDDEETEVLDEDTVEIEVTYSSGGVRSDSDGCFIATAVYGDYDAGEVLVLRSFRDNVLQKSPAGQLFIKAYYALSPPVADYLAEAETLNSWVKSALDWLVGLINNASE